MNIAEFDFDLPENLIALYPPAIRGQSRLLLADQPPAIKDADFAAIIERFSAGDVLVINNTEVIKARLFGQKHSGGHIEILIERILDNHRALAHIRASKAPKAGTLLHLENAFDALCTGREEALFLLELCDPQHNWSDCLQNFGHMPLPPYIDRAAENLDDARYQTVYAQQPGAVAAPTAGLHFTNEILDQLKARGVDIVEITLHVGAGTFQPVRVENIAEHQMHHERFNVSQQAVARILQAQQQNHKVCAVGTTSLRALESAARSGTLRPYHGDTDIFITPGYPLRTADYLLTNFHLPKSTLLMLVSAFAGYDYIKHIYQHAITQRYRFFSYGDAMLLKRQPQR